MYSSKVYWLSEPTKKRASYNTSGNNPQKVVDFWVRWRYTGIFLPHFKTNPETSHCQWYIYIYPIISLYHHDVRVHHQFLHHLNTIYIYICIYIYINIESIWNLHEFPWKIHHGIMVSSQEHLSHRRQNEHHPKRLRRLMLWTSLNIKKKQPVQRCFNELGDNINYHPKVLIIDVKRYLPSLGSQGFNNINIPYGSKYLLRKYLGYDLGG